MPGEMYRSNAGYSVLGVGHASQLVFFLCFKRAWPAAGLPKLMDANDAGGRNSEHCTLILTEGDSAKSLVVGGLSVAGRDRFGVFPLRCASKLFLL